MSRLAHLIACLFPLVVLGQGTSPTPTVMPAPATTAQTGVQRMEQLEATYLSSLRERHRLVMQKYIADLRLLQSRVRTPEEKAACAAEMGRIAQIVTEQGGIVTLGSEGNTASPKKEVRRGVAFTLDPDEATPVPAVGAQTIQLGKASWRLSRLAPGKYDVVAEYSCPALPVDGAVVSVQFAGLTLDRKLSASQTTTDSASFRILRLGQLVVTKEQLGQEVIVEASAQEIPWFFVKRIMISKSDAP